MQTLEQRSIEDEIAKCDERMKNIKGSFPLLPQLCFYINLNAYRTDYTYIGDVELQLETILDSCNEAYPRRGLQESHDKSACQSNKRMKLCEPIPCTKSMCQKLDDLCVKNNWVLPSYHVSLSDGGFEAEVRIKETQFAYKIRGEEKSDAEEARESAAACLLTKLHQNTTTANDVLTNDHLRSSSSVKVTNPSAPSEDPFKMEKQTSLPLQTADLAEDIYAALERLRSDIVKASPHGVMSYHIFANPTLQRISKKIPRNKEELLKIDGLGMAKVKKYGDRLLETIESTINEYNVTNKKGFME
uniref:HRDC domain-containing protein n=1 Tax=Brassica campestris TaxID=3711 RepID=M4EUG4_BRACM